MLRRLLQSGWPLRRKNLRVRIARKRDRTKDRFTPSNTKEPPVHSWFNMHKSRAMLQEYQRVRNLNRLTISYDEPLRKEFVKAAEEYSLYKMHQFYGESERLDASDKTILEAQEASNTLPTHLRDELFNGGKKNNKYDRPIEAAPFIKYYDQLIKIYPKVMCMNIIAARRLGDIATDAIKFHES